MFLNTRSHKLKCLPRRYCRDNNTMSMNLQIVYDCDKQIFSLKNNHQESQNTKFDDIMSKFNMTIETTNSSNVKNLNNIKYEDSTLMKIFKTSIIITMSILILYVFLCSLFTILFLNFIEFINLVGSINYKS